MYSFLRKLAHDRTGSTLVEFALLAPALFTAIIGIIQVGAWVQNYNAIRNVSMDTARFTAVEYQKGNQITAEEIKSHIVAKAVSDTYNLNDDRLTVTVNEVSTRITGLKEFDIDVTYTTPDWLAFVEIDALNLTYSRPVFVPA